MIKTVCLTLLLASAAMAESFVFNLGAASNQGVTAGGTSGADFRQSGIKGPRSKSLTVAGALNHNGTTNFSYSSSVQPDGTTNGFNFVFDSLSRTSFSQGGGNNSWNFSNLPPTSFQIFGRFSPVSNTYGLLFSGSFSSGIAFSQIGGGTNTINQTGVATLNLNNVTPLGLQFLQYFSPTNTNLKGAKLQNLSFKPNSSVGASGGFTATGANLLAGQVSFLAVPEPATFTLFGLGFVALGLLRRR